MGNEKRRLGVICTKRVHVQVLFENKDTWRHAYRHLLMWVREWVWGSGLESKGAWGCRCGCGGERERESEGNVHYNFASTIIQSC